MTFHKQGIEIAEKVKIEDMHIWNQEYTLLFDLKELEKDLNIQNEALAVDVYNTVGNSHTIFLWKDIEIVKCDKRWKVTGYKCSDRTKFVTIRLVDLKDKD